MRKQALRTRSRFTDQEKSSILEDHFDKGIPVPVLARKHGIHPITLYNWKRKMSESGASEVDITAILKENERLQKENKNLVNAKDRIVEGNYQDAQKEIQIALSTEPQNAEIKSISEIL